MQLHFLDRKSYKTIHYSDHLESLTRPFQPAYIIPEGGSNSLAVDSCAEYIQRTANDYDIVCCACGTGGTMAGFIKGLKGSKTVIGFPALKGADFLNKEIRQFLSDNANSKDYENWSLITDYHFGGYAKSNRQLEDFIVEFYNQHSIILEPVYTGKMMFALYDLIKKGYFKKSSRILAIHTGGLQGLSGFTELKQRLALE